MFEVEFRRIGKLGMFASVLVLAGGCGGSGDSDLGLTNNAQFNALLTEGETLADKSELLELSVSLPEQNSVIYNGVFLAYDEAFINPPEAYVGDFSATVDFNDNMMHGDIDTIYLASIDTQGDPVGEPASVAGSIDVDSTTVSTGLFTITFSGNLFVDGTVREIDVIGANGFGLFLGTNGDMFDALGTLEFDGTDTALGAVIIAD